jgi:asparagine synthase (glutamine-hydrolysing)
MCGIAGTIRYKTIPESIEHTLDIMQQSIRHRGPDGAGRHTDRSRGFLNVRLAIVDREGGSQPIYNQEKNVGIVYNGEVYNFPELRKELSESGATFTTTTDTEVILQAYLHFGTESFKRLNGMFAFCLWDERSGETFIVRDQIGIKPLYIYQDSNQLLFASEIKAILAIQGLDLDLDQRGISDYLTFRYTQAPFTCFKNISRLEAGNYLRIKDNKGARFCFWDLEYKDNSTELKDYSVTDLKARTKELLLNAVRSQLMGEVPIGVLLSGGVDSSVIAWCIHTLGADLTTYNIGFPELNEFEFSREVAKAYNLKHVEICTSPEELLNDFDTVLAALDEPIADPACFPLYQLCKELKKSVTVVLSGEGGDELFGGYPQYARLLQSKNIIPEDQFLEFLDFSYYFRDTSAYFNDKYRTPHFLRWRKYFLENESLNRMLAYDMRTWMPENLMMKADKILMKHSLEGRFPFLDQELFAFTTKLPCSLKISPDQVTKWILKEAFADVLPKMITQRPKMGFSVPVDSLLLSMRERVMALPGSFKNHKLSEILDLKAIENTFTNHFNNNTPAPLLVWTITIFLSWFEQQKSLRV